MLRIKYRKIGSLALIPRILGGDIRHAPSKFQKCVVNVQRIAEKSTNSKSNNHDDICEKCRQLIEMSFGPNNETPNTTEQSFKKPESHDIFNPIQDIRKKHMSQNFNPPTNSYNDPSQGNHTPVDESGQGNHTPEDESRQGKHRQADESHQGKDIPAEEVKEGFNLQHDYRNKGIANMRSMNNNETQYLTEEGNQMQNVRGDNKNSFGDKKTKNEDTQQNSIHPQVEKAEPQQHVPYANEFDYWKNYNYPVPSNYHSYTGGNVHFIPPENNTVNSTTTQHNEDKLTQKQENIEEAPIVETPKTNTEGFNIDPKVLNESEFKEQVYSYNNNTYHHSGGKEYDEPSRLDSLAKKCLDAPRNEIDERLLKEMNKLGVPQTGHQSTDTPLMNDELIQMDVLKRPKKPVETTDIDLESSKYENNQAGYNDIRNLYPTYMSGKQELQKVREEAGQEETVTLKTTKYYPSQDGNVSLDNENDYEFAKNKHEYDPNQVLIDPYGKKITEADECDDYNSADFAITHAASLVPDNMVQDRKKIKTMLSTFPFTTSEALEYRQNLASIPETKSEASKKNKQTFASISNTKSKAFKHKQHLIIPNTNAEAFESFETFASKPKTNSEASEHKQRLASISNTNSVEQEQIVNISATREFLEMPKQRINEPQVNNSSQNLKPDENELIHDIEGDSPQTKSEELEVSHNYVQQDQIVHPLSNEEPPKEQAKENFSKNITPLPITNLNLNQELSLTELLKRVRYRNRVEYCSSFIVNSSAAPDADPIVGKCGAPKKPPCPPPAPICPTPAPCPPPPCPPPPPKCPKPCKPKCPPPCPPPKKNPCEKYKKTCFGGSFKGLLTFLICTPSTSQFQYAAMLFNCLLRSDKAASRTAVLTDEVIESLESVGKMLVTVPHQHKIKKLETEMAQVEEKSGGMSYARDYEPWVPIPSWPIEKKEEKKPFICPKEGCKQIPPPPRSAPCNEKPCTQAPKRIFSPIVLFSTLTDENIVHDYREI